MNTVTHPNGTKFEYVPPYKIVKAFGRLSAIRDKKEGGVRITLSDGTKIYRPNSYYE